jgi:DNA repair exonuclease SbcCD ATPase subunit
MVNPRVIDKVNSLILQRKLLKMKKLLLSLLVLPFWMACSNEPVKDPVKDSLTEENEKLSGQVLTQDAALDSFFRAFNDIQANLDEIKQKEKIINSTTAGGDVAGREQQIKGDIQAIYDLMIINKQRLAAAKKNLKKSETKIASLNETIANLEKTLAEREAEIVVLKEQLEKMNLELSNLTMNYQELQQEVDVKTEKLNTAFYAYGSKEELIKNGVLNKEGGFIGIGKQTKVSDDMNKEYFTRVDVTQFTELVLSAKKATVATTHPADSYKIEGTDGRADKLVIIDAEKFWSVSKYLVIIVK